ncbi:DUF58 domain-containing protein, partial [Nocardia nova]|nr:DUF58 domain-containing protein [Nocardia nova]
MIVTGRLAVCAAVAAVVVGVALPSWAGVVVLTSVLAVLVAIDVIACRADDLELSRVPLTTVRVGHTATVELTVLNRGARAVRARLWDDWPPSAQAPAETHRLQLPPN